MTADRTPARRPAQRAGCILLLLLPAALAARAATVGLDLAADATAITRRILDARERLSAHPVPPAASHPSPTTHSRRTP